MAGNLEVTDLPVIPAVDGADVYGAKNNLDYRIRTGEAGGLATLDGAGMVPSSQLPNNLWVQKAGDSMSGALAIYSTAAGVQGHHLIFGKDNGVARWSNMLEADASYSFVGFDAAAANAKNIWSASYATGNTTFTNDIMVGGPSGQMNYGGFGKGVVVQSINNSVFELVSTRPDLDGALIGAVSSNWRTNAVNHQRFAEITFNVDGVTSGQRGGRIAFWTKANGSTTLSERMRIAQDGTVTINGSATVGGNLTSLNAVVAGNGQFISNTTSAFLATTGAGTVFLRPNGIGSATGEMQLQSSGDMFIPGTYHANRPDGTWAVLARNAAGSVSRGGIWVDATAVGFYNANFGSLMRANNDNSIDINGTPVRLNGAVAASSTVVAASRVEATGNGDPGQNAGVTAFVSRGSFGGGYNMIDGVTQARLYMTNVPDFRIGLSGAAGAVTNYFILNSTGATAPNFTATSDKNLKKDITDRKARDRLPDLLRFVEFLWKKDDRKDVGLIAQEVREVAPEYVYSTVNDEGVETLSVDKASLALECVIGLAARVKELEEKVNG